MVAPSSLSETTRRRLTALRRVGFDLDVLPPSAPAERLHGGGSRTPSGQPPVWRAVLLDPSGRRIAAQGGTEETAIAAVLDAAIQPDR